MAFKSRVRVMCLGAKLAHNTTWTQIVQRLVWSRRCSYSVGAWATGMQDSMRKYRPSLRCCHESASLPSSPTKLRGPSIFIRGGAQHHTRMRDVRPRLPTLLHNVVRCFITRRRKRRGRNGGRPHDSGCSGEKSVEKRHHVVFWQFFPFHVWYGFGPLAFGTVMDEQWQHEQHI